MIKGEEKAHFFSLDSLDLIISIRSLQKYRCKYFSCRHTEWNVMTDYVTVYISTLLHD